MLKERYRCNNLLHLPPVDLTRLGYHGSDEVGHRNLHNWVLHEVWELEGLMAKGLDEGRGTTGRTVCMGMGRRRVEKGGGE